MQSARKRIYEHRDKFYQESMKPSEILRYYLNEEVMDRLLEVRDRECAVRFGESFGKRPMYFQYRGDIENMIRTGATSFHVSEERWNNPLELNKEMTKEQLSSLRKAWDMLIDVDCKNIEISKIFSRMIKEKLEKEGIHSLSVKFSGGSGFHILVPFEAFPQSVNHIETNKLFPDAPMTISIFLKKELEPLLRDTLRKDYGVKKLASMFGMEENKLMENGEFDPYKIIDIDTVLITERHMFRMQYSLNEKKWLVSVPIDKNKIEDFTLEDAKPENIDTKLSFFDLNPNKNEANSLFIRAYDKFEPEEKTGEEAVKSPTRYSELNIAVNPEYFPPCIKLINEGLSDGKKRSVFILTNFYRTTGRNREEVLKLLLDWNKKNKPPLKENLIRQQVDYAFSSKQYPPPNCDAQGYYKYFNVCFPDETCKLIKNPLSYYVRKSKAHTKKKKSRTFRRRKEY